MAKLQQRKDKVFFRGKEDKNEHCVGFLVHTDIVNTVMGCRPVSRRFITIRLRAAPFNITIVQVYAPTSEYDETLQNVIDQAPKKDILVVQGDWNAKVGRDACRNWQGICGAFCNDDTNERGLRLLEPLLATVKRRKLAWFGHVTCYDTLSETIHQGTLEGGRGCGRQRKCWMDNIKEWTSLSKPELSTRVFCRKGWKRISAESSHMSPRLTNRLRN